MAYTDPKNIHSTDTWVKHPKGRIFVRTWTGPTCQDTDIQNTPIVLFHDSLGCVNLWREFPAQLAAATGRTVIAYDRLGRSDLRVDVLLADFVTSEAADFFPVIREQLNVRRFIAFGHSVGGGMAIHCAAQFVKDCHALITESAQAFTKNCTVQAIATAKEQFKDETQLERLKNIMETRHAGSSTLGLKPGLVRLLNRGPSPTSFLL